MREDRTTECLPGALTWACHSHGGSVRRATATTPPPASGCVGARVDELTDLPITEVTVWETDPREDLQQERPRREDDRVGDTSPVSELGIAGPLTTLVGEG